MWRYILSKKKFKKMKDDAWKINKAKEKWNDKVVEKITMNQGESSDIYAFNNKKFKKKTDIK